ncbi:RNA polymerase sigma factor [Cupriavidus sp. TA19]|uniref:RNA polymerase sigma factor n=1 Tax=Cupriavidus sp. TA19 TaxID=701108 RepID=UPI0027294465|nr:RNA polymerase sigma factor [Cupriavidus sp. TA19]GLC98000.1 RNA polymerase sigma factor [Cupriavidus sp. TA19]
MRTGKRRNSYDKKEREGRGNPTMPNDRIDLRPPPLKADPRPDADLVASARAGSADAFAVIMRLNNRLLFRAARGVVADDAEAQDIVQETYLRAFTSLDTFRGDAALSTWLVRIAINTALSAQRTRGRFVPMEQSEEEGADSWQETLMAMPSADSERPDAMAERGQMRDILQAAIERLPAMYRSVFMLRAVEDMSVDEAAFCLGVSGDVVKTRFLRARMMLRAILAEQAAPYLHGTFQFAGSRCDAVVSHVLGQLDVRGLLTPH